MIFVVDIGNTNIVLGLYDGQNLVHHWRLATESKRSSDEYKSRIWQLFTINHIDPAVIEETIVSCVVPPIIPIFHRAIYKLSNKRAIFIDPTEDYGMPLIIDNPKELGADRISNAIAGYEIFKSSLIIVDFGTATTFDIVSNKGEYLGGVISPGIMLSLEALWSHTSRLPRVEIERPKTIIGKNTIHGMQSGILFGYAGMVDSLVENITKELNESPKVIATGGLANLISRESKRIEQVIDNLTLSGIFIIYSKYIKVRNP